MVTTVGMCNWPLLLTLFRFCVRQKMRGRGDFSSSNVVSLSNKLEVYLVLSSMISCRSCLQQPIGACTLYDCWSCYGLNC